MKPIKWSTLVRRKLIRIENWIHTEGHWVVLSTIFESGLLRVLSSIPVVGYVIIWSDKLNGFLQFEQIGGTMFLTFFQRLNLLYFGGVFLLIAFGIYHLFCPWVYKRFSDEHDYFSYLLEHGSSTKLRRMFLSIDRDMLKARLPTHFLNAFDYLFYNPRTKTDADDIEFNPVYKSGRPVNRKPITINIKEFEIYGKRIDAALHDASSDERNKLGLVASYYFSDQCRVENTLQKIICWILLILGSSMFILPSIEVFFMVVRTVVD